MARSVHEEVVYGHPGSDRMRGRRVAQSERRRAYMLARSLLGTHGDHSRGMDEHADRSSKPQGSLPMQGPFAWRMAARTMRDAPALGTGA